MVRFIIFMVNNMENFTIENIDPSDVYSDKELQNDYTKLKSNGETVAVIIPFHKSVQNKDNGNLLDSVNISELINDRVNETEESEEDAEDNSINKEIGDFRKRLQEKQYVDLDDNGGTGIYSSTSFNITTIDKI